MGHNYSFDVLTRYYSALQVLTILTGHPVIDTMRTPNVTLTDVHLAQLAELLGPFPVDFLHRCARRSEYFDDSGKFCVTIVCRTRGLTIVRTCRAI